MADRLLVSTKKGLFVAEGGRVVRSAFLGENVSLALPDPRDGGWYAALNLGHFGAKLKYSPDGGQTWEERAVPAYPEGETFATWDGKPPQPATMKEFWALAAGPAGQPGRLWAGTTPGGLFKSDDGGQTWELVRSLWDREERKTKWFGGGTERPAIHSICIDPRDPKVVRLAVSCGGVWQTTDDGATWELLGKGLRSDYTPPDQAEDQVTQDPHIMKHCESAPDRLWIQHHNGIFRSDDGGRNWEEIKDVQPSVFGFGVAVHPREPDTAWFAPAVKDVCRVPVDGKLVVTRTRNGGKSFTVLRNGLPQEQSYDLIYRHALVVDETGNNLAIGSTTGGVWTTADQGDHWAELPARLPPVHAVCYA
jgi:photosystem II stability/assembly factor-like uncharacterized protein